MVWILVLAALVVIVAAMWALGSLLCRLITRAVDSWAERLRVTDPERYANFVMLQEARKGR
ncbi:hypothetical protein ACWGJ9_11550 [Curtobacterium citreum]